MLENYNDDSRVTGSQLFQFWLLLHCGTWVYEEVDFYIPEENQVVQGGLVLAFSSDQEHIHIIKRF